MKSQNKSYLHLVFQSLSLACFDIRTESNTALHMAGKGSGAASHFTMPRIMKRKLMLKLCCLGSRASAQKCPTMTCRSLQGASPVVSLRLNQSVTSGQCKYLSQD